MLALVPFPQVLRHDERGHQISRIKSLIGLESYLTSKAAIGI